jgi:hypothetical protein
MFLFVSFVTHYSLHFTRRELYCVWFNCGAFTMGTKAATLNLRLRPEIKLALEIAAERECRSLTGLVEWLVMKHCNQNGIDVAVLAKMAAEKTKSGRIVK